MSFLHRNKSRNSDYFVLRTLKIQGCLSNKSENMDYFIRRCIGMGNVELLLLPLVERQGLEKDLPLFFAMSKKKQNEYLNKLYILLQEGNKKVS
jgi:hypothetical protein